MGAEPRNGHAGLRYRAQRPAGRPDDDQRVASLRGHPGHDAAVRELGHRRLPESPVRAVELGLRGSQGHRGLGVGDAGVHVGLPPPQAVRNEAQAAVALPSRLPHRDVVTAFDVPRGAGGDQPRPSARPVDRDLQRRHHHRRSVPRHIGVVPHRHGQPLSRRIEPGGTVEVVSFARGSTPRRSPGGRRGPRCNAGGRARRSRRDGHPRHRSRDGSPVPPPPNSRPRWLRVPRAPSAGPPSGGRRARPDSRPLPHTATRPRHSRPHRRTLRARARARARARGRDSSLPRRTHAPGSGCSRLPASRPPRPCRSRLARTNTTRPPSAGRDSSQYTEVPSEATSESDTLPAAASAALSGEGQCP